MQKNPFLCWLKIKKNPESGQLWMQACTRSAHNARHIAYIAYKFTDRL